MALSAEEVNFLVYRYLQESGHTHSAFTFAYESLVTKSSVANEHSDDLPPGALVSFIQKGLMYLQVEQQMATSDSGAEQSPSLVNPKTFGLLRPEILETMSRNQAIKYAKWTIKYDKNRDDVDDGTRQYPDMPEHSSRNESWTVNPVPSCHGTQFDINTREESKTEPADSSASPSNVVWSDNVAVLSGHDAEVFCCSWHPHDELLASGSGDSTVRLWDLKSNAPAAHFINVPPESRVLEYAALPRHGTTASFEDDHDVIWV